MDHTKSCLWQKTQPSQLKLGNLMAYIKGNPGGLRYPSNAPEKIWEERGQLKISRNVKLLEVFSDIGFGTGSSERSMQGMAIFFGGLVISWQTTVQPFVTHSTAESELVGCDALSAGSGELFLLSVMQGPAAASPQVSAWQQYLRRVTVYAFVALGVLSAQLVTDDQACKIPEDEWLRMYHLIIKNTV